MTEANQGTSPVSSPGATHDASVDPATAEREALSIIEGPDATVAVGRKTADPLPGSGPKLPPTPPLEAAPDATTALGPDSPARKTGGHEVNPNPRPTPKPFPLGMALGLGAAVLAVGGFAFAWLGGAFQKKPAETVPPSSPAPSAPEVEVPPALRAYLRDAQNGDAKAMRMLGVMYYNGLNCPQNREEGRKWFTKAAEAGSDAARKDLEQLGLPVPPKKR